MTKNIYRFKGNFKSFLFVTAVLIVLGFLYYTQLLVNDLQRQSLNFLNFRLRVFQESINSETVGDLSFLFQEVIEQADYPIIYSDSEMNPVSWRNVNIPASEGRNISPDTLKILKNLIRKFDAKSKPLPISYQGKVLGYYHYGESAVIRNLRWLPYIEIGVVGLFILIGYAGFSSIKRSEERLIWVGMAKETAHQLGTPLSSLFGWKEYLFSNPRKARALLPEVEKDLKRLQTITNRFSQIGSIPDLKATDLADIIEETVSYFRRRLPKRNGKVKLEYEIVGELPLLRLNRELFSWVLENLIRNALDAIEGSAGKISIRAGLLGPKSVFLDVEDTGKGIGVKERKNIFKPGFSTKKRGWGLGLSLGKRIIEEYHQGKLTLKSTHPGRGATFRILLKTE